MSESLEQQIRRYTDAVDRLAPPVEELMPSRSAGAITDEVPLVEIEIPIAVRRRPASPARVRIAMGVAAVALVAVAGVAAAWLITSRDDTDVTDEGPGPSIVATVPDVTSTPTVPGTAPAEPAPPQSTPSSVRPHLVYDATTGVLSGSGWVPGAPIEASQDELVGSTVADADGGFAIGGVFDHCCTFGGLLVVTDGESTIRTIRPEVTVTRVDPDADIVAGTVGELDSGEITVSIADGSTSFETTVAFAQSDWSLDLGDRFDLVDGMTVTVAVDLPDITGTVTAATVVQPTLRVADGPKPRVMGWGWAPETALELTIDGTPIGDGLVTSVGGAFEVPLGEAGARFEAGSVLVVTDGVSQIEFVIPPLTIDTFDPSTYLASGRSGLPDGTRLQIELWLGIEGGDTTADRQAIDTIIAGGRWEVRFEPSSDLVPYSVDLTYPSEDVVFEADLAIN